MANKETISILGYNIFIGNKDFFADGARGVVNTLNPHCYIIARVEKFYRDALMRAEWLIPDGIGIVKAAKFLYGVKINRITGSDLHETILKSLDSKKGSCFYLGSSVETLEMIREKVSREFQHIRTGSFSPPFKKHFTNIDSNTMIKAVNDFKPDVLFVGMTAPKQEKWVYEHRMRLNAPLICSIGAVFDFYAGTVKRSGEIWIKLGLEWMPRLLREPRRLWERNFVSTPLFIWYVFSERLKKLLKL